MSFQGNSGQSKVNFFNESFYHEKISQPTLNNQTSSNTYISYEFTKRYFQATRINELINKTVRTTLQSFYLPQNPYNMIGRLLLHDCIFQNIRAYYSMMPTSQKSLNSNQNIESKKIMGEIKFGNQVYISGYKLINLIRIELVNTFWSLLFEAKPKIIEKKKNKKSKMNNITYGLGGSLILKIGSPYSAEESLTSFLFINMSPSQNMEHFWQFSDFIINDCIQICQSPANIFMKLLIYNHQEMSTQWSSDNLVHSRTKVAKQIYKACVNGGDEIKVQYLLKIPQQKIKIIGTAYVQVTKTYILIQEYGKQSKIHSKRPISILLNSVFTYDSPYEQNLMQSFDNKGTIQQLVHGMFAEMHDGIIYGLKQQEPSWVGWSLFFIYLYDTAENKNRDLKAFIDFMIDSPLGFIDQLRHQIRVAKILSSRSSSASHQKQIIQLLQKCEKKIKLCIQKQQHIYPQTVIFFQAVRRNLELVLQQQKRKQISIKPTLQRIQVLVKYLLNSFYQICFVLKGYLLNQIIKIDNEFGKEGSGLIISSTITYDIFLRKYKDLPDFTLNMTQQVSRLRQQIQRSDDDIRQLIIAKYVKTYRLYQQIYEFYWGIICGKKLTYPMGQFVTQLRNQAIQFQYNKQNKKPKQQTIQQTKTDGIMIYQKAADTRGQNLFYSLCSEVLEDQNVSNYRIIKQIFGQYFQNDIVSQSSSKSLSHLQKNSYIISICTNIGRIKSEESDFNKCKIFVDSIYHVPIASSDIYRLIYNEITQKLEMLDKNGFGVIGIYNGDKQFMDQDQVLPWIQHQQKYDVNFLRYQAKKVLNIQLLTKLIKNCKQNNSQILLRGVFWLNGLLKSCEISFNFLINKEWIVNLASTYQTRVFSKHEDIARWGNYNGLKEYLQSKRQIKQENIVSKGKLMSNHIDFIRFATLSSEKPLEEKKIRNYSPFYNQLQQSLSLVETFFYFLQYVKTDRQGKFQIKDFKNTVQLLQYYLFEKCLRMDKYIYSEGLSVSIINMVSRIHRYIDSHEDNNGQEKQLICLQKITIKLTNCIHYSLTSCAFGVIEAIQNQYIVDQNQSDEDD